MPDTLDYMITGYVLGLALLALIIFSIWWRYRSLKADEAALARLEQDVREGAPVKTAQPKPEPASEKADVAEAL